MTYAFVLLIFKTVVVCGLAIWSAIVVVNNIIAFKSATASIFRTMTMVLLESEPRVETPLLRRKVRNEATASAAMAGILLLQTGTAAALAVGGVSYILACTGTPIEVFAATASLLGLAVKAIVWICMLCGGLWFGYGIRQEGLQNTHIGLLALTLAAVLIVNVK